VFLGSSVAQNACFWSPKKRSCGERFLSPKWAQEPAYPEGEKQMNDALLSRIEECRKLTLRALRAKYQKRLVSPRDRGTKITCFGAMPGACKPTGMATSPTKARQRALAIADDSDLRLRIPQRICTEERRPCVWLWHPPPD